MTSSYLHCHTHTQTETEKEKEKETVLSAIIRLCDNTLQ